MRYPVKTLMIPERTAWSMMIVRGRVRSANRQAQKYGCQGTLTVDEWLEVFWAAQGRCTACGSPDYIVLDHIVRLANGGSNTKENLQVLCYNCHLDKSQWEQAGPRTRRKLGTPRARVA